MKLKKQTERVPGEFNEDGSTKIRVTGIKMTDYQVIALRAAMTIVLALTLVAVTWSTYSIGNLLGGGVGFTAAVIFDLGWAVALLLEYLARYNEEKRKFPERLGWTLLGVTMVAIAWDGYERGSWAMAIIGAFVSLFAKALWMGVMKHVNAELTDKDKAELHEMVSAAQKQAAFAQVRRATARIEQKADLELLAMGEEKKAVARAFGLGEATIQNNDPEPLALAIPQPTIADMGKADAIKFVMRALPSATPEEIHTTIELDRDDIDLAYVKQTINRVLAKTETETEPEAEIYEFTPAS